MFLGNYRFGLVHEDLNHKLYQSRADSFKESFLTDPCIGIMIVPKVQKVLSKKAQVDIPTHIWT